MLVGVSTDDHRWGCRHPHLPRGVVRPGHLVGGRHLLHPIPVAAATSAAERKLIGALDLRHSAKKRTGRFQKINTSKQKKERTQCLFHLHAYHYRGRPAFPAGTPTRRMGRAVNHRLPARLARPPQRVVRKGKPRNRACKRACNKQAPVRRGLSVLGCVWGGVRTITPVCKAETGRRVGRECACFANMTSGSEFKCVEINVMQLQKLERESPSREESTDTRHAATRARAIGSAGVRTEEDGKGVGMESGRGRRGRCSPT